MVKVVRWKKLKTGDTPLKEFEFTGNVICNFVSLAGVPCMIIQNPKNMEMFLAHQYDEDIQPIVNPISTKEQPPLGVHSEIDPKRFK
jgi:hypothetical protein